MQSVNPLPLRRRGRYHFRLYWEWIARSNSETVLARFITSLLTNVGENAPCFNFEARS